MAEQTNIDRQLNTNDQPSKTKNQPLSIGLALGGGGARGLSHIGVLKALTRAGIRVDYIAGTSIGAIIGSAFASGMSIDDMEALALRISRRREQIRMLDFRLTGAGLLKGTRLYRQFSSMLGEGLTFADLRIPMAVMAVDVNTGREVMICDGPVADAVRASMSVPAVFEPVERDGMRLADGGLLNNVPTDVLCRAGMDIKIAVDVLPNFPQNRLGEAPTVLPVETTLVPKALQHMENAFLIMIAEITEYRLKLCPPDVIIRPQINNRVTLLSGFERAAEIIAAGEAAAEAALPEIKEVVESKKQRVEELRGRGSECGVGSRDCGAESSGV
jgi:NTE family protein